MLYAALSECFIPNKIHQKLPSCLNRIVCDHFHQSVIWIGRNVALRMTKDCHSNIIITDTDNLNVLDDYEKQAQNIVIETNSLSDLNDTLAYIKYTPTYNARAKFLVIIKKLSDVNDTALLLWNYNLYKSLIAVEYTGDIHLYAVNFECDAVFAKKLISSCADWKEDYAVGLYEGIFRQEYFSKCKLMIQWTMIPPWVIGPNVTTNQGLLISVMNIIGK